jgi:general secretion pathway protein H
MKPSPQRPTLGACAKGAEGFTLLELLVVLLIIALGSAGVALSLRMSPEQHLEQEAQRLVYWLELARQQSSTQGQRIQWVANERGYSFVFNGPSTLPKDTIPWLGTTTQVISNTNTLVLGPEPILSPQFIELGTKENAALHLKVGTRGVEPFAYGF